MTHGDTLAMTVAATHRSLEERLGEPEVGGRPRVLRARHEGLGRALLR